MMSKIAFRRLLSGLYVINNSKKKRFKSVSVLKLITFPVFFCFLSNSSIDSAAISNAPFASISVSFSPWF